MWLSYKQLKAKTYTMKTLYKNHRLSTPAKANFNDSQTLKMRINGHNEDLYKLVQSFQHFIEQTIWQFHETWIALNNRHATNMFIRTSAGYMKGLSKYDVFYDTFSKASQDFLSALDLLLDARLAHQIINPPKLDTYVRVIFYD